MRPCLTIAVVSVGMRRSPGRRYLSFVLLALLAEIVNLFEVVLAVDPMKFSPLTPGQGSEDGMVEHSGALAKASFALRNLIVQGGDPRPDVAYDFFNRHPAR